MKDEVRTYSCPNCCASIKRGQQKCEYCDSYLLFNNTVIQTDTTEVLGSKGRLIGQIKSEKVFDIEADDVIQQSKPYGVAAAMDVFGLISIH